MAKAAAQAMPDDEDEDAGGDAAGEQEGADAGQGDEQQPEVIGTILCFPDGSYGLTQGDENEEGTGDEDEGGNEPERFASLPELLKGVMEVVKDYESQKSGQGSEAQNFAQGYSDDSGPTLKGQ